MVLKNMENEIQELEDFFNQLDDHGPHLHLDLDREHLKDEIHAMVKSSETSESSEDSEKDILNSEEIQKLQDKLLLVQIELALVKGQRDQLQTNLHQLQSKHSQKIQNLSKIIFCSQERIYIHHKNVILPGDRIQGFWISQEIHFQTHLSFEQISQFFIFPELEKNVSLTFEKIPSHLTIVLFRDISQHFKNSVP